MNNQPFSGANLGGCLNGCFLLKPVEPGFHRLPHTRDGGIAQTLIGFECSQSSDPWLDRPDDGLCLLALLFAVMVEIRAVGKACAIDITVLEFADVAADSPHIVLAGRRELADGQSGQTGMTLRNVK
jgi:hypothetical protein